MTYLDNASTSFPKPDCVLRAMNAYMTGCGANPSRSLHKRAREANSMLMEARKTIAAFFNIAEAFRIVFGFNATECIKMVYQGYLREGDHVVISAMEHKAMIRPLQELERQGISHTLVYPRGTGDLSVDLIEEAIQPNTVLVGITSVSNVTGTVMPVAEIGRMCSRRGIPFMVDGSQGAGTIDIDVGRDHIDVLVCSGHKGLMGPQGTGFVFLSDNVEVRPCVGHVSQKEIMSWHFYERYEIGTLNCPGIAGLAVGVRFIEKCGRDEILRHEKHLATIVVQGLSDFHEVVVYGSHDSECCSGVVAFNIEGMSCMQVAHMLDKEYDIGVRAGLHCATYAHKAIGSYARGGAVRASFGWFNTEEDAHALVQAVGSMLRQRG